MQRVKKINVECLGVDNEGNAVLRHPVHILVKLLHNGSNVQNVNVTCGSLTRNRCFAGVPTLTQFDDLGWCRCMIDITKPVQNSKRDMPPEIEEALIEIGAISCQENDPRAAFDYGSDEVPEWYTCAGCKQTKMQLWTGDDYSLYCKTCIKPKIIDEEDKYGNENGVMVPSMQIQCIGKDWVPAIPICRGYTDLIAPSLITQEMIDWWNRLPEETKSTQEKFFE